MKSHQIQLHAQLLTQSSSQQMLMLTRSLSVPQCKSFRKDFGEILGLLNLTEKILSDFGFKDYEVNLSTRPDKSVL
jgi:threonyl-tRNA synthetase